MWSDCQLQGAELREKSKGNRYVAASRPLVANETVLQITSQSCFSTKHFLQHRPSLQPLWTTIEERLRNVYVEWDIEDEVEQQDDENSLGGVPVTVSDPQSYVSVDAALLALSALYELLESHRSGESPWRDYLHSTIGNADVVRASSCSMWREGDKEMLKGTVAERFMRARDQGVASYWDAVHETVEAGFGSLFDGAFPDTQCSADMESNDTDSIAVKREKENGESSLKQLFLESYAVVRSRCWPSAEVDTSPDGLCTTVREGPPQLQPFIDLLNGRPVSSFCNAASVPGGTGVRVVTRSSVAMDEELFLEYAEVGNSSFLLQYGAVDENLECVRANEMQEIVLDILSVVRSSEEEKQDGKSAALLELTTKHFPDILLFRDDVPFIADGDREAIQPLAVIGAVLSHPDVESLDLATPNGWKTTTVDPVASRDALVSTVDHMLAAYPHLCDICPEAVYAALSPLLSTDPTMATEDEYLTLLSSDGMDISSGNFPSVLRLRIAEKEALEELRTALHSPSFLGTLSLLCDT